jgi:ribosomal-protein-alanine N-acetyltransferase
MMVFREAKSSDIDSIMYLEDKCFNIYTRESKDVYENRIKYFPEGFIVLESDNIFCGAVSSEIWNYKENVLPKDFILGHPINEQLDLNGNELYISSIGILPEYRSNGYGKKLFNALIAHIKMLFPKVTKGILLLNETWTHAKKIYQDFGFQCVCEFPDFFIADDKNKQKAIVMRKASL